MQSTKWVSVAVYPNRPIADAATELLSREQIPSYVSSNAFVPGLGSNFEIKVPEESLRRARRLLENSGVSESELTYLATGKLPESDGG